MRCSVGDLVWIIRDYCGPNWERLNLGRQAMIVRPVDSDDWIRMRDGDFEPALPFGLQWVLDIRGRAGHHFAYPDAWLLPIKPFGPLDEDLEELFEHNETCRLSQLFGIAKVAREAGS